MGRMLVKGSSEKWIFCPDLVPRMNKNPIWVLGKLRFLLLLSFCIQLFWHFSWKSEKWKKGKFYVCLVWDINLKVELRFCTFFYLKLRENGCEKIIRSTNSPNQRAWVRINVVWQCRPFVIRPKVNNLECGCSHRGWKYFHNFHRRSCLLWFIFRKKWKYSQPILCLFCVKRGGANSINFFHFPQRWLNEKKLCAQFISFEIISLSEAHFIADFAHIFILKTQSPSGWSARNVLRTVTVCMCAQ